MSNQLIRELQDSLSNSIPKELVDRMFNNFEEAIENYLINKFDSVVMNAGKFVEANIRVLEYMSTEEYTPMSQKLGGFTQTMLNKFEQEAHGEPYRTLIPRALYSMYCIRNKRGGIHLSATVPSKLDATKLIQDMKWVIFEHAIANSAISENSLPPLLNAFSSPLSQVVWDIDNTKRVLSTKLSCRDQILVLLCTSSSMSVTDLLEAIEYKNHSRFKQIIASLHKQRLINYSAGRCTISPTGKSEIASLTDELLNGVFR